MFFFFSVKNLLLGNLALAEIWLYDCAFLFMYLKVK